MAKKRVVVVGAGIIGASLAFHLAVQGAEVIVIDRLARAGGVATPHSWAWINASWGNPMPYFKLRHRSMALWHALERQVAGLRVNWCGGLLWDLPPAELAAYAATQAAWGYGARHVTRTEIQRLEPELVDPPELGVHVAEEGAIEPVYAVQCLAQAAQALGATFQNETRLQHLVCDAGVVTGVATDAGVISADEVVLAAGAATPELLASLGIKFRLDTPAGMLVHSEPTAPMLKGLVMAPEVHVRQTAEGRLVAGSDFGGAQPGDDADAAAQALFKKVQAMFKSGDSLKFGFYTIGYRPTPPDGVPAVGRIAGFEGLYVIATHSGVTLAPALGAFGATEIMGGERQELLQPFSPQRLMS